MLIAFAGLPGTGKSTLATCLAERLHAILLNKDRVRACLFAPEQIEYSRSQDDFVVAILYQLAEYHLRRQPARPAIVDGRTYSQTYQVDDLKACADRCGVSLKIIECTCSDEVALNRLALDATHPAADRGPTLYYRVKADWQTIIVPRLVISTDHGRTEELVARILRFLDDTD